MKKWNLFSDSFVLSSSTLTYSVDGTLERRSFGVGLWMECCALFVGSEVSASGRGCRVVSGVHSITLHKHLRRQGVLRHDNDI